ncbi:MAG: hypothetical protein LBQ33_00770 [Oscillospiraceae bacterium]|jgi:ABC-type glycerol-3-phosphate transport system permease component|nr:hypothetical protein [Oscillospiraceae bacterium]
MRNGARLLRLCWERRWSLLFLNVTAGLFFTPFLYWNSILAHIALGSVHTAELLLGMNVLCALGGLALLLLAAFGLGGCLSALRKLLDGSGGFLPQDVFGAMPRCAGTSLPAGLLLGLSVGVLRVGLVDLHSLLPASALRCVLSVLLVMQLLLCLPLCVLAMAQEDALQKRPWKAFCAAAQMLFQNLWKQLLLLAATVLPPALCFVWQLPPLTFLSFVAVLLFAFLPGMLAWTLRCRQCGAALSREGLSTRFGAWALPFFLGLCAVPNILALLLPLLRQGSGAARIMQATLRETLEFLRGFVLLDADNGAFRDLLADSSVWLVQGAAWLGAGCCILVTYACALYRFPGRKSIFGLCFALQLIPLIASYSSLDQLLRNLRISASPTLVCALWALLYLGLLLLFYHRFTRLRPRLLAQAEQYSGARLFLYCALPKTRLFTLLLLGLVTFGSWNRMLAPFWYLRRMGAFSVSGYVWAALDSMRERTGYLVVFLLFIGILLVLTHPKKKAVPSKP